MEVVRIRPSVFFPVKIPLIGGLFNAILPVLPGIRRLALTWVVVARPLPTVASSPSLSIVIPARNERGNLESALVRMPTFATQDVEIIFVEGNSTDNTWDEIQRLVPLYSDRFRIVALQQSGRGKNDAVRLGFSKATGGLLTILDADLTMPPELLPRFYNAWCHGHAEFINGNRLVYPMEGQAMRRLNLLGNRFFAKALSYVLGIRVGDSLCGTKLLGAGTMNGWWNGGNTSAISIRSATLNCCSLRQSWRWGWLIFRSAIWPEPTAKRISQDFAMAGCCSE